jgi:hypothetical protein
MPVPRALVALRAEHAIRTIVVCRNVAKHNLDRAILDLLEQQAQTITLGLPASVPEASVEIDRIEGVLTLLFDVGCEWRMVATDTGKPIGPWLHFPPEAGEILAASAENLGGVTLTSRVVPA